ALAVSMGFAISSLLTRSVEDWEWENTAALARREVERTGVDALLTAPRGVVAREASQREFARLLQGLPEVVRVKVWDRHATVLWSNEPRLIGQRFPDNDELNAALAARENAYERGSFSVLAEVYVPIFSKTTGQVIGVIEVYKSPLRLLATIQRGRLVAWSISLAGALVLYLVLFPLVRQVYGRHVREEAVELLAYPFRIDNVEVTCRLGKDLPQMWAEPHQLQQVLVNLLTNAHHAMRAAAQPRRIVLTTRYETATDRVVLTVADSGP